MTKTISVAAISIWLSACAASGPEAPATTETVASAGTDTAAGAIIQDSDAPTVEMSAGAMAANESEEDPNEIICRRETPTGSNLSRRVCRTRAEIEARAAKDQENLRNSRATQSSGACVLNTEC